MSLTLQINGRTVSAESGQTVLQAARANGIAIPTLCDFPGLPSHGSCRMCIVEVEGRANTPTACTTPVNEGMVVRTETPQLRELRQEILRMLLADHPSSCLFCPENAHCEECMVTLHKSGVTTGCRTCPADRQCELQNLVADYQLQQVGYPVRYRSLPVKKDDPFLDRDPNLCILCGRCVNVCASLHFKPVPVYVQRGSRTQVGTSFDIPYLDAGCSFCGACLDACPTGALTEKTRKWDGKPDAETSSACPFCSLGCEINLLSRHTPAEIILGSAPAARGDNLCVKGRFGVTELVNHPRRLLNVWQVNDGHAVRTGWDEGLQAAADRLADCPSEEFALLVSANCTCEELFMADRFSRHVMGRPAVLDAGVRYGSGLGVVSRLLQTSKGLDALQDADLVLLLGMDLRHTRSQIQGPLLQAVQRAAKVISMHAEGNIPVKQAGLWLKPEPGNEEARLMGLMEQKSDEPVGEAARLLTAAHHPVVVVGPDYLAHFPQTVERLCQKFSAQIIAIPAEGNLAGALQLGLGSAPAAKPPRVLYLLGTSIPDNLPADTFVIYQNTHLPKVFPHEGICLPMAAFTETAGTLLDQSRRVKNLTAAVQPPDAAKPAWQITVQLAQAMQKPGFGYDSLEEIRREMSNILEQKALEPAWSSSWPTWLDMPGEHSYLGVDLSERVDGLAQILKQPTHQPDQEGEHVYTA